MWVLLIKWDVSLHRLSREVVAQCHSTSQHWLTALALVTVVVDAAEFWYFVHSVTANATTKAVAAPTITQTLKNQSLTDSVSSYSSSLAGFIVKP